MLSGFKAFILRGNVIDLAVAVVIGAAFTAVVNTIVEAVFNPLIGALFNAESLATALPVVIPTAGGEAEATIYFGAVIAAIIQFLLVAVVVYFAIVAPMNYANKLADARKPKVVEPEAGPTEAELLLQIRDLLAKQNS
ncbi:large conductance mechanosensitive channel protein MscL [Salinibacterium amurskyense]|uniref:large conductance mechanosensitive channel protein MscL n=1 Tax=Salinibacterium amurskyense TaxID=205941 RepID=UPI00311E3071